jgi:hypothetical protein
MAIQVAMTWSEECEKELINMGFNKKEMYIKHAPGATTEESIKKGNAEFFSMRHIPFQFFTTSWWGAGVD